MTKLTWADVEERRKALPKPMSRAELARRAGLSESTIGKGLREDRGIYKATREKLELVLDAAQKMAEAGL